jgi:uncharacterized hydrophobic protein (TIGR00271 family)
MLLHLRLTVPEGLTAEVLHVLRASECITNLTVLPGVVEAPSGDLVECDVAREAAGELLQDLDELGLGERGGIVVSSPLSTPFDAADRLEQSIPGHPDDAVIWDSVEAQAEAGAVPTLSFHAFLVLAVVLAAIAVVTDSAILVIGAMVVGPEFSAIAAACAGIARARWRLVARSLQLLALSFLFAVLVTTVLAVVAVQTGLLEADVVTRPRPNTQFIWHPDRWSFIVAVVAGAAGALALAIERTAIMVGVFISVTTVPAAGNLALGLAVLDGGEIRGSLAQLGVNVAGMLVAGTLVLLFVRACWPWLTRRTERLFALGAPPVRHPLDAGPR